jgi:inner membrane protein involved in colicin E2 resistance
MTITPIYHANCALQGYFQVKDVKKKDAMTDIISIIVYRQNCADTNLYFSTHVK